MKDKKGQDKSQNSVTRNFFNCLVIYGKLYIIKFVLLSSICALNFIFSNDAFSVSLNITLFLATVFIDMCALENHMDFFKKNIANLVQFIYWIILLILLAISAIITLKCAQNTLSFEQNPLLRRALIFFVVPCGVISPFFEMVYSIPSGD